MIKPITNKFIIEWQFILEASKLLEIDEIYNSFRELLDKYEYTTIDFNVQKDQYGIGISPLDNESIEFIKQLYDKLDNAYKFKNTEEVEDELFENELFKDNPCNLCQLTEDECIPEECEKIIDYLKERQSDIIMNKIDSLIRENKELKEENEDLKKLFDNLLNK